MTVYYVTCQSTGEYCVDVWAQGHGGLYDLCRPCLRWVMTSLDVAAGADLPWAVGLQVTAEIDPTPTPDHPVDARIERWAARGRRIFRGRRS